MHNDEKYNQFPYQNPKQGITMRNIINSLIKTHRTRHNNEKYNQLPYQNPSQGITMRYIINPLIKNQSARRIDE